MISFVPLTAPLGAFVRGFDPSQEPDESLIEALAAGLLEHAVLVFRGHELAPAQLVQLGHAFGGLEILPEPDKRHP